ncbi:MAG: hypothetical protein A3D24_04610 [Candidatus Blackburnbacteria bacterium RIFCSPHIGHO2_02_FULL_39_13]|uniref:Uncharacterized protein n=1 Tax=Candidatus Blackburnbacteria bacterium RIFCSPLOWO2_01_FULL_40_20 TaxID=1797519 RepID=A0A1G1VD06_9BACT|nr:MAG: hypothetical protein A3D24_04610 [Candidatus Blackburnbacteria bacterium RIFCSPHIGHO2_02_FULL_39_13]OGY13330.1 MAG: hypothetical protein A3A77_03680 [Candidatus Blackburnbacteria bacterium RIFCSPLOWO2_01_FULL_40_20]
MSPHNLYLLKGFNLLIPIAGIKGQPETAYDWIPFGVTVVGRPGVRLSLFDLSMSSENIIKGRIAETIVSEMLQRADYLVYRFGYEGVLQSLIQKGLPKMRADNITAEKIRTMPDFIVMDRNNDVFFVEVKCGDSAENSRGFREWLRKATKYWPEAKLILVYTHEPYFEISTIKDYAKTRRLYRLYEDKFLPVDKKWVTRYRELVMTYLSR